MKRSRSVALVLMGTAAALGGCDERATDEAIFHSIADCRQFYDEDICRTKSIEAEKLHAETAPKYQSKESCEAAFGAEACVPAPTQTATGEQQPQQQQQQQQAAGGGGWFMPAMMGFILGRALSPPVPLYYGPPSAVGPDAARNARPLYSGGSYVGNTRVAGTAPRWNAAAPATQTAARSTLSQSPARGGFGSTGRSYSGGAGA